MKAKAVNGYAPDEAANDDLARLFFQHNAIVDGVVRTGRVIGSGRSFAAIQLAELSARADAAADDTDPASILEALPAEGEHDGSRELIVVARKAILLGVARDEFPSVAARWNAKRAKPWDEDDLLRRYDDARARWEAEGARRPIVQLHPSRLEPTIRETMRLLAARGDMFDGPGGELVHVHEAKARAAGSDALIGLMDRTVQFVKPSREGPVPVVPSKLIADQILACFDRPFPPLAGIVRRPFLRDDGSDSAPGYDASTGLIFAPRPGVTYPEIPERPTLKDVLEAFERMLEPLDEMPWLDPLLDPVVAISAGLTIAWRNLIRGPVPMNLVRATTQGSGKDLLVDVIVIGVTGDEPTGLSFPANDEEGRKLLLSVAREAPSAFVFRNVRSRAPLASAPLEAALTSTRIADRLLGTNTTLDVDFRSVPWLTANGAVPNGDLGRRTLVIDLDPRCEAPEARTFKRPNLRAFVQEEHPRILAGALTILRAFIQAGRPRHGLPPLGSFEAWDELVRAALIYFGVGDPCATRARLTDEDPERGTLRSLIAVWRSIEDLAQPITARTLATRAQTSPALRSALESLLPQRAPITAESVGRVLRSVKGRVVVGADETNATSGHRIVAAGRDKVERSALWAVEVAS